MLDTRDAYEKAGANAEEARLERLFGEMTAMRVKHHEQLHRVLLAMGEQPDDSGSFMSNVHRTVIAVRSAVKGTHVIERLYAIADAPGWVVGVTREHAIAALERELGIGPSSNDTGKPVD